MKKVTAVIVTFNNVDMLELLLQDLSSQTQAPTQVIVVDNAQSEKTLDLIKNRFSAFRYIGLKENSGSAGGFHEGIRLAQESSDLIWTLDDDVRLNQDSLEMLVRGFETLSSRGELGAVRSVGDNHFSGIPTKIKIAPWRGTLFSAQAVKKIGLPLKELFIYGEDLEYSLRLEKNGYLCFWVPASKCVEKRMGYTDVSFFGKEVRIYAKVFQLYYAFRNGIYIYNLYKNPAGSIKTLLYGIKVMAYILITEGFKGSRKIKAVLQGFCDGLSGKLGKNSKYLP